MKLIVGLGNPGKEYENTRHNVGFNIIDNYAKDLKWSKEKDSLIAITNKFGEKIILLKPQTYMNLSGNAVKRIADYYKINPCDVLVIQDDLDLPILTYRLKYASSSGGHNGIKSIISTLGTNEFARLKVGIGHSDKNDTKDFVLDKLSKKEVDFLKNEIFTDIINNFINKGISFSMNKYN